MVRPHEPVCLVEEAEEKPKAPIDQAVCDLAEAVGDLGKQVESLEGYLQEVLVAHGPTPAGPAVVEPGKEGCELRVRLCRVLGDVACITRKVIALQSRLEL